MEAVDLFYLSMPFVTDEGDGSQDALVVRVAAGGYVGWGECEASPLVSVAAFITPMSHGACRPISVSVLGQAIDGPEDITRMASAIAWNSMDLLQAPHTWSGVEIALWDLLGRMRGEPVWKMLGYRRSAAKRPYASVLCADDPHETLQRARVARAAGFAAVKFGWGPIGRGTVREDADQFAAAREGLGPDGVLLIDAGQIWCENVEAAAARLPALEAQGALWLEEPFSGEATGAYRALAALGSKVSLAGGEASHNLHMGRRLVEDGGIAFLQIDSGRVGGIGPARALAGFARERSVAFVNHTFTSHLALSASLQPYAGIVEHDFCEYPFAPKPLARELTATHIVPDAQGRVFAPDKPGLGIEVDPAAIARYLVEVEIKVGGKVLYVTPAV